MKLMLSDQVELTDQGAKVFYQNTMDTIEGHMLKAKVFRCEGYQFRPPTTYEEAKNRPSDALKIGYMYLPKTYQQHLYASLWLQYLKNNPKLVEELQIYTECEHPILNLFVKDRGKTLMHFIQPFFRIVNGQEHVVYVQGDLLRTYAPLLCHQVNCQGMMEAGLALQLSQRYKNLYFAYRDWLYGLGNKLLGDCQWVPCEHHVVVNLYGQDTYGQDPNVCYTNINALKASLLKTKAEAKRRNWPVALPYGLGCGLGGANWEDVLPMIEDVFQDYYVLIYQKKESE